MHYNPNCIFVMLCTQESSSEGVRGNCHLLAIASYWLLLYSLCEWSPAHLWIRRL
jgi:hypothetical protein